jgi:hypothetical protein
MKKSVKKKLKKPVKRSIYKARGVSKVVLLAIVAVVLVGAGGVYFFTKQNGGGASTALPFVKPALNPNCKYNDPELCKFMNNFPTQTNYAVSSTSNFGGMSIESVYEISGEDKFHMLSKQNGKESSNTISIGDTTYTLDYTDNKWWKQTLKPEDPEKATEKEVKDQFTFDDKTAEDKTTYKFIAKEPCGDRTCFKYEMISPDSADTKVYMWFDDKDYLMRKMRMEDKTAGATESIYSYDNISISAPAPVKEGTPNNYGSMPDLKDPQVQKMMQQYQEQSQGSDTPAYNSEPPADSSAPEEY